MLTSSNAFFTSNKVSSFSCLALITSSLAQSTGSLAFSNGLSINIVVDSLANAVAVVLLDTVATKLLTSEAHVTRLLAISHIAAASTARLVTREQFSVWVSLGTIVLCPGLFLHPPSFSFDGVRN